MIAPQSVPRLTSENVVSQTGSVFFSSLVMVTSASVNSFHDWMKAKTPVATRPGARSGKVILKNAPILLHPSIIAASSSSAGSPFTNPRRIQMVKGRTAAT